MGIAEATRGNHLDSAKVLQAQLDVANEQLRRLTAVLAAVLIDKHRGRILVESATVDVAYGDTELPNGYMVDVATLKGLGQHRLQVVDPSGALYVPKPEAKPVIEAPVDNTPCLDDWHKAGVGLRCPTCGKTRSN